MIKKLIYTLLLFAALAAGLLAQPARAAGLAQEPSLTLGLNRNFGYSSIGSNEIQGVFTIRASGPENLQRVVFYLDGEPLGEVTQAPYNLRFSTDDHSVGRHTLSAVGYTADGQELRSNELSPNFVTSEQGMQAGIRIVLPLLVVVFGGMGVMYLFTWLSTRKKPPLPAGAERKYGVAGGAICPRCSRPFTLNMFDMNISPVHRLARCPNCGRFGAVRRRSLQELRAAERAELTKASGEFGTEITGLSEEEKLRQELEKSRYQDL